ncbi:MAG: hypothetical protein KY393_07675 [Actinobacteria bacterium]|nr:hypothetical protein [Actinomycetota bacterium]
MAATPKDTTDANSEDCKNDEVKAVPQRIIPFQLGVTLAAGLFEGVLLDHLGLAVGGERSPNNRAGKRLRRW